MENVAPLAFKGHQASGVLSKLHSLNGWIVVQTAKASSWSLSLWVLKFMVDALCFSGARVEYDLSGSSDCVSVNKSLQRMPLTCCSC